MMDFETFCQVVDMPASSQMIELLYDLYKQAYLDEKRQKGQKENGGSN